MHALTRQLKAAQAQYESESPYDDAEEAAWERREEWIADHAPAHAENLIGSMDFALTVFNELDSEVKDSLMDDLGRFFERVETDPSDGTPDVMVDAAVRLWRVLRPYVEAAAGEQAKTEVAAQYDADMARMEAA